MAVVAYLLVIIIFLGVQSSAGRLSESMTVFVVMLYLQLTFLSWLRLYRFGFIFEAVFFLCFISGLFVSLCADFFWDFRLCFDRRTAIGLYGFAAFVWVFE